MKPVPARSFEFVSHELGNDRKTVRLSYDLSLPDKILHFVETMTFPQPLPDVPVLKTALQNLHLIAGISYWKLYCPPEIRIAGYALSEKQAAFWNKIYTAGLGEFFYRNTIDFTGLVKFPHTGTGTSPITLELDEKALVGIGGGKDSAVTAELLKQTGLPMSGFVVRTSVMPDAIREMLAALNLSYLEIKRQIDPQLLELNKTGQVYNGHIPISAIHAFLSVVTAVAYGYKYIITSNEKSANIGNVEYKGITVNHQWSKSEEFERLFQEYTATYITPSVTFFSILRPLSEMKVVELFSKFETYFPHFKSCNTNFRMAGASTAHWCGVCPKCLFVFVLLGAFIPKSKIIDIFNKNLLDDMGLVSLYRQLLGVEGIKPFECVGTPNEVQAASYLISKNGEFKDSPLIAMFEKEVLPTIQNPNALVTAVMSVGDKQILPEQFRNLY